MSTFAFAKMIIRLAAAAAQKSEDRFDLHNFLHTLKMENKSWCVLIMMFTEGKVINKCLAGFLLYISQH